MTECIGRQDTKITWNNFSVVHIYKEEMGQCNSIHNFKFTVDENMCICTKFR